MSSFNRQIVESGSTGIITLVDSSNDNSNDRRMWRDKSGNLFWLNDDTSLPTVNRKDSVSGITITSTYQIQTSFNVEISLCISSDDLYVYIIARSDEVTPYLKFTILDATTLDTVSDLNLFESINFDNPKRMLQSKDGSIWFITIFDDTDTILHKMDSDGSNLISLDVSGDVSGFFAYQSFCINDMTNAVYVFTNSEGANGYGIKRILDDGGTLVASTYITNENPYEQCVDCIYQAGYIYALLTDIRSGDRPTRLLSFYATNWNDKTKWSSVNLFDLYGIRKVTQLFSTKQNKYGYFFQEESSIDKGLWRFNKSDLSCEVMILDGSVSWSSDDTNKIIAAPRLNSNNCDTGSLYTYKLPPAISVGYVYIVGASGQVWELRTHDDVWTKKTDTEVLENNDSIATYDSNNSIVLTDSLSSLGTSNGGDSWINGVNIPGIGDVIDSLMISDSIGLAIKTLSPPDHGIYRTTDRGLTWTKRIEGYVDSIHMLDSTFGFANIEGFFYKTIDGGITWTDAMA